MLVLAMEFSKVEHTPKWCAADERLVPQRVRDRHRRSGAQQGPAAIAAGLELLSLPQNGTVNARHLRDDGSGDERATPTCDVGGPNAAIVTRVPNNQ